MMAVSQKVPQYIFPPIPFWPQHFQQHPYKFEGAPAVLNVLWPLYTYEQINIYIYYLL